MIYIMYNDLADNGRGKEDGERAEAELKGKLDDEITLMSSVGLDWKAFFGKVIAVDKVILTGGDGTLNYFINHADIDHLPCEFFLYPMGTGNDFLNDVKESKDENGLVYLNEFVTGLPIITVKGKDYRFINGIGYGIDGECCVVAEEIKEANKTAKKPKKISYSGITIKLLWTSYKAPNCKVNVDGKEYSFKKSYLASAMNGRYYGGGMMIAPMQERGSNLLTFVCIHGKGKLGTFMMFPKLFKGTHVKYKKNATFIQGKDMTISFDRPMGLQIDGEVVKDVTEYTVHID